MRRSGGSLGATERHLLGPCLLLLLPLRHLRLGSRISVSGIIYFYKLTPSKSHFPE